MCVPCRAKKILDQQTLQAVKMNDELRRQVQLLWTKKVVDDEAAQAILEPLMKAERAFLDHNVLAVEKASQALRAAKALSEPS